MTKGLLTLLIVAIIGGSALAVEMLIDRYWPSMRALWRAPIIVAAAVLVMMLCLRVAAAHDSGQWEASDPAIRDWYQSLMQPDVPTASCCGEADAYYADEIHVRKGKTYAMVTDDRPDEPRKRPHVPVGTEFEIPPNKLKWDRANPTGHAVLFLSRGGYVFCFVQGSGI